MASSPKKVTLQEEINLEHYKGDNPSVLKMKRYLSMNLREDLCGAYVHGSLGTYEKVTYSDFDALVIIKDEVLRNSRRLSKAAIKLNKARSIMYEYDPLQHHGWFVLTEADLNHYPEYYFPIDVLKHSKSLFFDKGLELDINSYENLEFVRITFFKLIDEIMRILEKGYYAKNVYYLKCLLSQVLLIPALYAHIRFGKGIFKKYSFDIARKDSPQLDWNIMDTVSEIRKSWHYDRNYLLRYLGSDSNIISRYLIKKYSPKIPESIKKNLTDDFRIRLAGFIKGMKETVSSDNYCHSA